MTEMFLKNITVVDLTTRLPGPFATMILQNLGAKIVKFENANIGGDPFKNDDLKLNYFNDWYKNINQNKDIQIIDFIKDEKKLIDTIHHSDLVLINDNKYHRELINKIPKSINTLIIAAGINEFKNLHDINALALTETFKEHLKDSLNLPYLPFAGISFAQQIATTAVSMLLNAKMNDNSLCHTIYLKDSTQLIFDALKIENHKHDQYLHTGKYPCYQLYELKNNAIACLGAVEEKFWVNFISVFQLELNLNDRFDESGKVQEKIKNMFANYNSFEIKEKIAGHELCLTLIHK